MAIFPSILLWELQTKNPSSFRFANSNFSIHKKVVYSYEKLPGCNLQWLVVGSLLAGIGSDLVGKKKTTTSWKGKIA